MGKQYPSISLLVTLLLYHTSHLSNPRATTDTGSYNAWKNGQEFWVGKVFGTFWVAGWKSAKVFKTSWTWQCLKPIMKCFHWLGIFENWKNLNGLIMCKCLMQQNNLAAAFASPKKYHWEVFPSMQSSKQENNWVNAVFQEVRMGSEPKNRSSQPKIIFPLVSRVKRAAAPGWGRTRKACKI